MQTVNRLSLFVLVVLLALAGCENKPKEVQQLSEVKYNPKVAAFTSGMVSNQSEIMVRFSELIAEAEPGNPASSSILKISPSIKGEFYWVDNQSLAFKAEDKMKSGTQYDVKVKLAQLFKDAKDDFEFSFQTISQNFRVEIGEVAPYDNSNLADNKLSGKLILSDFAEPEQIHKMLTAEQKGEQLEIEWLSSENENHYPFLVHHIKRADASSAVKVKMNGESIGVDRDDSEEIKIPSINDFELLNCKAVFQPRQGVEISFTDPLNPDQELAGLIELDRNISFTSQVEDNVVKILPNNSVSGTVKVTVHPGIENVLGR